MPVLAASKSTISSSASKSRIAETNAAFTTLEYSTFIICAMMNAVAPMMGGIYWPPVEATASTAPAKEGL